MILYPAQTNFIAVGITLQVLAVGVCLAREAARRRGERPLGADDLIILASLVAVFVFNVIVLHLTFQGTLGVPRDNIGPSQLSDLLKVIFFSYLLGFTYLQLIKISIVIFYKRIFKTNGFAVVANIVIGVISVATVANFIATLLAPSPISAFWKSLPFPERFDSKPLILASSVVNMVFDALVISLPLAVIKSLHMSTRKKFYVAGVFLLGAVCLLSSIVRTYNGSDVLRQHTKPPTRDEIHSKNLFYLLWFQIELWMSIIAACLPTLGPLFQKRGLQNATTFGATVVGSDKSYGTKSATTGRQESAHTLPSLPHVHGNRDWFEMNAIEEGILVDVNTGNVESKDPTQDPEGVIMQKSFPMETNSR